MPATPSDPIDAFLERQRRSALGGVRLASGRITSGGETTLLIGASNLLAKALRRLAAGDEAAATGLVRRALALEVEGRDAIEPGPMAAHALLVEEVARSRAARADEAWLDDALALLGEADPAVATELGRALVGLLEDEDLTRGERDRIRTAVRQDAAYGDPLLDVPPGEARTAVVVGLLRVAVRLRPSG